MVIMGLVKNKSLEFGVPNIISWIQDFMCPFDVRF
jgi:hypothetical protein